MVEAGKRYGPVHLAKIDIADGFYRVWLRLEDIPKLGVVLPTSPGQPALIAFPLTLPMGWVESRSYFTVLTETACDLANNRLRACGNEPRTRTMAHRLEAVAATPPPGAIEAEVTTCVATRGEPSGSQGRPPVAAVDVYVDDFLLMAQTGAQCREVMRTALITIDDVFRPLSPSDPSHR